MEINEKDKQKDPSKESTTKISPDSKKNVDIVSGVVETTSMPLKRSFPETRTTSQFEENKKVEKENIQLLFEITLSNLMSDGQLDERDFLDRADILCSLGYTVMISNYKKYYKLCEYLSRYTVRRLGLLIGVDNLVEMFEEKYYRNLNGGIMEAFGIMLTRDI